MSTRTLTALLAAVWLLALTALVLGAQHRVPRPDEGHFASAAYNLSHHGFAGTTTIDPDATGLLRIRERTYWAMPIYMVTEAAWFLLFPSTILWARMLTIVLLVPVAWQLYRIVDSLTANWKIAIVAAILLPADYAFMFAAVSARPDVLCLLFGLTAIASYLKRRESNLGRALLIANFWLALSALTHPNALLHLAALIALVIAYDRRRINLRMLVGVALIYVAVAVPFVIWASRDFEAFRAQMYANGANNGRVAQSMNPVTLIAGEVSRYTAAYGLDSVQRLPKLKAIALLLYASAILIVFASRGLRQQPGVAMLVLLWGAYLAVQTVFNQKLSVYLVHILPIYVSLLAAVLVYFWNRSRPFGVALAFAVAVSVVLQCGGMFWTARTHADADQRDVASFLRSTAGAATSVNGTVAMLFALEFDPRLVEDHALGLTTSKRPDVIVTDSNYDESFEAMAKRRPALLAEVRERLREYPLVFKKSEYRVYFSPAFCGSQGSPCQVVAAPR